MFERWICLSYLKKCLKMKTDLKVFEEMFEDETEWRNGWKMNYFKTVWWYAWKANDWLFSIFQVSCLQSDPPCILRIEQQVFEAVFCLCWYRRMPRDDAAHTVHAHVPFLQRRWKGWRDVWARRRASARSPLAALVKKDGQFPTRNANTNTTLNYCVIWTRHHNFVLICVKNYQLYLTSFMENLSFLSLIFSTIFNQCKELICSIQKGIITPWIQNISRMFQLSTKKFNIICIIQKVLLVFTLIHSI